ncbi:hypothetical protein BZH78_19235 [Salmonella enterica]|nr:hypothetical protein [Salmonella enterica]ECU5713547.1 hypothetical protein [Salmonella enterica subsp. enterica serovar Kentucky]
MYRRRIILLQRRLLMKKLVFQSDRSPTLNTMSEGLAMADKFRSSSRWIELSTKRSDRSSNDNDFRFSEVVVWKECTTGKLVKLSCGTNRKGKINHMVFEEIESWPEPAIDFENLPF